MIRAVVVAGCWVAFAVAAGAQAKAEDEPRAEAALFADFGFAGRTPTGRHAPVRVWVQAGRSHVSGWIELEYRGGFGLPGRIVAPVEVAAGRSTSVPLVVAMPEHCQKVGLKLRSEGGGLLAETVYEAMPGATTLALPPMLGSGEELLLSLTPRVSATKIAERFVAAALNPGERAPMLGKPIGTALSADVADKSLLRLGVMGRAAGVTLPLDQMPLSSAAYEGVLAVIADGSTVRTADPRAVFALQRWVLGGGRLVVLADQPGSLWRSLPPLGWAAQAIEVAPTQEIGTPAGLREVVGGRIPARLSARPMSLRLVGADLGWRERWKGDEGSLIVEGPVGFGWVTILSVHPDDVGASGRAWRLWAEALTPAMEAIATQPGEPRTLHSAPGRRYGMSLGRAMPGVVFDSIGHATAIGSAAIALVALVTVSLAVALGPVDYLLLRALRLRHLAWLSALVWIGVASGVAIIAPGRLRAGPSTASRLVMVDALLPNGALASGAGQAAFGLIPDELRAWTLGMTHLFAGSADRFEIDAGGAWFEYSAAAPTAVARPMTVYQSPSSGGIEAVRAAAPIDLTPGIWAVRTYLDQGPVAPELSVSLAAGERGWDLELAGLGPGARIVSGQLRVGGACYRLGDRHRVVQAAPTASLVFEYDLESASPAGEWGDPHAIEGDRPYMRRWMHADSVRELMPSALLAMPGPAERGGAIEALLGSGRFAEVSLFVTDQPMDIGIASGELVGRRSSVYRLVVPIEGGPGRD